MTGQPKDEAFTAGSIVDAIRSCADQRDALLGAAERLVAVIDMAGIRNLSRGVELGRGSWSVKAHDAMNAARAAIRKARGGE